MILIRFDIVGLVFWIVSRWRSFDCGRASICISVVLVVFDMETCDCGRFDPEICDFAWYRGGDI